MKNEKVTDYEHLEKVTLSGSNEAECANKFLNNKNRRGTNIFLTEDPKQTQGKLLQVQIQELELSHEKQLSAVQSERYMKSYAQPEWFTVLHVQQLSPNPSLTGEFCGLNDNLSFHNFSCYSIYQYVQL